MESKIQIGVIFLTPNNREFDEEEAVTFWTNYWKEIDRKTRSKLRLKLKVRK